MKRILLYLTFAATIFTGCKKDECKECTRETIEHDEFYDSTGYYLGWYSFKDSTLKEVFKYCGDENDFKEIEQIRILPIDSSILPEINLQIISMDTVICNCE